MKGYPRKFIWDKVERPDDLRHMWEINAKMYGDQPYFTYKKDQKTESVSYNRMHELILRLGTAFFKIGAMGENTALLAETRHEWMTSYLAVTGGNGIIVPLDKELAEEQIINFIERANVKCVIYSGSHAALMEDYARNTDNPQKKAAVFVNMDLEPEKENLPEYKNYNIYSFENLLKAGEAALGEGCRAFAELAIDREKPCAYLFTSGTTGTSKAVMLSQKNIASNAHNAACCVNVENHDRIVAVLPAHHTYETTCTFFAASMLGAHLCQNESLKTVSRNFLFYKPEKLVLVPLFVETLIKKIWDGIEQKGKTKTVKNAVKLSNTLRKAGIDLRKKLFKDVIGAFGGNLNGIICGGAPLSAEYVKTMDDFGVKLWQGYGITECSPLVAVMPENMCVKKAASVGYPVFQNEVKIVGEDENGFGEILVRGDNVMLGYLDNEEATREVMTEDGFFNTGDVGYLDSEGYLYITGRKKNIIILSNGKNIYPEEIEEYLYKIEGVKECAVIGRKDENGEESITALIFPDLESEKFKGKTPEEIKAAVKEDVNEANRALPVFKQVGIVEVRDVEFEKTTTKKIMRHKLK